ncbi:Cyclic nucleotide-gated cation channel beta-1, partial [Ophiophagus hannah]
MREGRKEGRRKKGGREGGRKRDSHERRKEAGKEEGRRKMREGGEKIDFDFIGKEEGKWILIHRNCPALPPEKGLVVLPSNASLLIPPTGRFSSLALSSYVFIAHYRTSQAPSVLGPGRFFSPITPLPSPSPPSLQERQGAELPLLAPELHFMQELSGYPCFAMELCGRA